MDRLSRRKISQHFLTNRVAGARFYGRHDGDVSYGVHAYVRDSVAVPAPGGIRVYRVEQSLMKKSQLKFRKGPEKRLGTSGVVFWRVANPDLTPV